jgi:hypothetical protein
MGAGLMATSAGTIQTGMALALPLTTAGMLDVEEGGRDQWLFNFDVHAGGVRELAEFDTSCVPHATFVGRGEFVAFGCRGSADKQDIAGFNLKGDAMWQQNFFDTHVYPTFAFAPEAGRFALGRTIVDGAVSPENLLSAAEVNAQEVRVYQSYSGQLLLRTTCTPAERAGQNFAISPDGLELAVVQETMVRHAATKDDAAYTDKQTAVEVYALPALTEKDRAAVKASEAMAPEDTGARIDEALARLSGGSGSGQQSAGDAAGAGRRWRCAGCGGSGGGECACGGCAGAECGGCGGRECGWECGGGGCGSGCSAEGTYVVWAGGRAEVGWGLLVGGCGG